MVTNPSTIPVLTRLNAEQLTEVTNDFTAAPNCHMLRMNNAWGLTPQKIVPIPSFLHHASFKQDQHVGSFNGHFWYKQSTNFIYAIYLQNREFYGTLTMS